MFLQYGVVDDFPNDLGIDNSAASSIAFVMLASFVSIYVYSKFVVAVVICYRQNSQSACCMSHLFGTETLLVLYL